MVKMIKNLYMDILFFFHYTRTNIDSFKNSVIFGIFFYGNFIIIKAKKWNLKMGSKMPELVSTFCQKKNWSGTLELKKKIEQILGSHYALRYL